MNERRTRRIHIHALSWLLVVIAVVIGALPAVGRGTPAEAAAQPFIYRTPVPGGLTVGVSGTADPSTFAAGQPFEVSSMFVWEVETQRWLVHVPGAPTFVNTLDGKLKSDSFVWVKRRNSSARFSVGSPTDYPGLPFAQPLPTPPGAGLTIGFAGTSDPQTLIAAQNFEVQTLAAWDHAAQQALVYIPGAPSFVNSLSAAFLRSNTIVWMKSTGTVYPPSFSAAPPPSFGAALPPSSGGSGSGGQVTPSNQLPFAQSDVYALAEDSVAANLLVLANDTDADGDTLTIASVAQGAHGVVQSNGGSVTYTPSQNYNGPDAFTYTVSDGKGGTSTALVTLSVIAMNDAPAAFGDSYSVATDGTLNVGAAAGVLANDTDVEGSSLTAALAGSVASGALNLSANGAFVYTPNSSFSGTDTFRYRASDGSTTSSTTTVTITVTSSSSVNRPPSALSDGYPVVEDGVAAGLNVLGNDTDPDGDSLTVTNVSQGAFGSVTYNVDSVTYTPSPNFNGTDTFTYTVSDGTSGTSGTSTASVTMTVTAVNDVPVAAADGFAVAEDSTATSVDVLANDTDADGDTLVVLNVTQGAQGAVTNSGGAVTYTPVPNFNGVDTFTYTVTDGEGGTSTATVTVTVMATNDAPVAVDDSSSVSQNSTGATIDVLANDSDIDGDALTVASVTQGANGSVTNSGGAVVYVPAAGYTGADSFTYTVGDGKGGSDVGTVAVSVTADVTAPVVTAPASISVAAASGSTSVPASNATIAAFLGGASATDDVDGALPAASITNDAPASFAIGVTTVTFTASDSAGNTGTAAATVTVTASAVGTMPTFPIRAAFYYPWFPEAWTQGGVFPYTNYTPTQGYYDAGDAAVTQTNIAAMQYGGIQAGIASWWGQGHYTDSRIGGILDASQGSNFYWTLYYEEESLGDPSVATLRNDLLYIQQQYAGHPNFLRVDGRFVVFVYADASDGCGMAQRWSDANTADINAYVVLKVFGGYLGCSAQPASWHQYSPAVASDGQAPFSYSISPNFWLKGASERLSRDITRWAGNVRDMVTSGADWQLVTTFNEWGEGTIVESAEEWASASGFGDFLDVLRDNGGGVLPAPAPTPDPTPTPAPPPPPPDGSLVFTAGADIGATSRTDASLGILLDTNPRFNLILGDLSYRDREPEAAWCDYIKGYLGDQFPIQVVTGNHEDDDRVDGFIRDFTACVPDRMASQGDYGVQYYFDVDGLIRVIMIAAGNDVDGVKYDYRVGDPQYQWLASAIDDARAQGIPWVMVGMHKVCLTAGNKPCEIGPDLMNLLLDKRVDLTLHGHDHDYQRSKQLTCASVGSYRPECVADDGADGLYTKGAGTVTVIAGNFGGGGFTSIDEGDSEYPYFAATMGDNTPGGGRGFLSIAVTADQLQLRFIGSTTSYTDSFTIGP